MESREQVLFAGSLEGENAGPLTPSPLAWASKAL